MTANTPPGPGVDASGQAVIDPTANVVSILEAAVQRQDDLRDAESAHQREILKMHIEHAKELRNADKELRQAESDRLDAIRAVDVQNVQTATAAAEARAGVLATQVTTTADAFRTAQTVALEPLATNIETLRQSMFTLQGERAKGDEYRDDRRPSNSWALAIVVAVIGAFGLFVTVAGLALAVYLATRP